MMSSSFAILAACGNGTTTPTGTVIATPATVTAAATQPSSAAAQRAGTSVSEATASTATVTTTPPTLTATPTTTITSSVAKSTPAAGWDDTEYRLSGANASANALAAYSTGASGAGIKIAIIDSGLSDPRGEFRGRIDPASRDMVGSRGFNDDGGHGTSVAAIAAAGRNGSDVMGIAFDATLLVERADNVGSCVTSSACSYSNDVLARSIDYARTSGARVINVSLGGSAPNKTLTTAVKNAAAAGIVVVVAAGNDGAANPNSLAQLAGQGGMNGLVVIAGSHDANYQISSFSNRAGSFSQNYLTAMGENVRAFNNAGTDMNFSGTSYSAPAISGAIALLLHAFPNLTPQQVVNLLYSTATDAGLAGVDTVFGQGILNLDKAFQPQGTTKVAGSSTPVSASTNGTLSTAMGDATTSSAATTANVVMLDALSRAYLLNLAATLRTTHSGGSLVGNLHGSFRGTQLVSGPMRMSLNMVQSSSRPTGLAGESAHVGLRSPTLHMLSGSGAVQVGKRSQIVFGIAESGNRLSGVIDQREELPYLVARDIDVSMGFQSKNVRSLAFSRSMGAFRSTFWVESGAVNLPYAREANATNGYQMSGVRLARQFNKLGLSGGATLLRENGTLLGARLGKALGGSGSRTRMLDIRASWAIAPGWSFGGAYRQAWTSADRSGALARGRLTSNAFALDLSHSSGTSRMGLRIAQPMRVTSSRYLLDLPTGIDLESGAVTRTRQQLNLAPKGREIDVEASYGRRFGPGWLNANLFLRNQPGNIAAASADRGMTLRYSMNF